MRNRGNQKAISLLIVVLHFAVFILFIEFAFYGLFGSIFQRVNYEKRKETAMDLMEMGQVYAVNMEKNGFTPETFLRKNLRLYQNGGNSKKYIYKSPPLIKGGYFTLEYYYDQKAPVKVISTGHFEGIKYSVQIK
ncbi:MAG: hypothetical protein ABRQ37_05905 [Candidatus Eremiobacterota bacterium]